METKHNFIKPQRVVIVAALLVAITALVIWALLENINKAQQIILISALSFATLIILIMVIKIPLDMYKQIKPYGTAYVHQFYRFRYDAIGILVLLLSLAATSTAIVNLAIPNQFRIPEWSKLSIVGIVALCLVGFSITVVAKTRSLRGGSNANANAGLMGNAQGSATRRGTRGTLEGFSQSSLLSDI